MSQSLEPSKIIDIIGDASPEEIGVDLETDTIDITQLYKFKSADKKGHLQLYNGMSSCNTINPETGNRETLYLKNCQVHICKNQYIDFTNFGGRKKIKIHYKWKVTGEPCVGCSCGGSCNYNYFVEDGTECTCEKKDPIDPGEENCIIC